MARTRLLSGLQSLCRDIGLAETTERPVAAVRAVRRELLLRRRDLLAAATAATVVGSVPVRPSRAAAPSSVAIVGGGIAGLNAALTLLDAGVGCTVYEASGRVGGRMHSDTSSWANGQVTEHCGELIDTGHVWIRGLAQRFGLPLIDVLAAQPDGTTPTYYFFDAYYPVAQAEHDFAPVYAALQTDLAAAGYPTTYNQSTAAGRALDAMSVHDWIDSRVPGGHTSPMGQLLDVAYDIEFGAKTTAQSALNIVYLLGFQTDPQHFLVFGQSDEHFRIAGGNEQLPRAIAAEIERRAPGTIRLNARLTGIGRRGDGSYALNVAVGGAPEQVVADCVVMAIPFSVLRGLDTTQAGFGPNKIRAIEQLGYGTNVKLQLQFGERLWNVPGPWGLSTGESYADLGYQNTWESTRGQAGGTGILVNYLGSAGAALATQPNNPAARNRYARAFLGRLEPVFPGIVAAWNGRVTLDVPLASPYALGSYSYWKVGQYTRIAGHERQPSDRCFFAGEHCSINFQGYMEGGAAEGARAARQVLADLGVAP